MKIGVVTRSIGGVAGIGALLVACAAGESYDETVGGASQALVSDGAHGGTTGFYFLPPLVGRPVVDGAFDGTLAPTVRVDELDAAGSVLRTVTTFTTGGARPGVRVGSDGYLARWNTHDDELDPSLVYRIRVLAGAKELGFVDVRATTEEHDRGRARGRGRCTGLRHAASGEPLTLEGGRTLPIRFWANRCAPVTCAPSVCRAAGVCAPSTGACSAPALSDGTACVASAGPGACLAGECVRAACEPSLGGAVPFTVDARPQNAVVADVTGDGIRDIVVVDYFGSIGMLRGLGDATFAPEVRSLGISFGYSLDLADVNGDGRLDAVTTTLSTGAVQVSHGRGDGTFAPPVTSLSFPAPTRHAVARDLDGDGRVDIVAASGGSVHVALQTSPGVFSAPSVYPVPDAYAVAVGDLDGDGRPELAVATGPDNTLAVFTNDGTGHFGPAAHYTTGAYPEHVALADVDGDGRLDIVTGNYVGRSISVFRGLGTGALAPFGETALGLAAAGDGSASVALADVDGDGDVDLVAGAYDATQGYVVLFANDGTGTFTARRTLTGGDWTTGVAAADLDGDGKGDVVAVEHGAGTVRVAAGVCE